MKRRLKNIEDKIKHQKKPKLWLVYSDWDDTLGNVAESEENMLQQILKKYNCKDLEELEERFELFMIQIGFVEIDRGPNGEVTEREIGEDKIYYHVSVIP
ncbi:MAG: hypothetical protein J7K36_09310 [Archaeoglobaceae archaeon]|nr:hypothetical protein [Archaeoglobaceae archaeon]